MTTQALAPAGSSEPTARVRGPADLVAIVPRLLGHRPTDSLVVVGIRRGRIGPVVPAKLGGASRAEIAAAVRRVGGLRDAEGVVLVVYADVDGDRSACRPIVQIAADTSATARLTLYDALHVEGDSWWSYLCADPRCCPPAGTRVGPVDGASTPIGFLDSRRVARILEPASGDRAERNRTLLGIAERRLVDRATAGAMAGWRAEIRHRFRAGSRCGGDGPDGRGGPHGLSPEDMADLLVALVDVRVRDDCWRALDDGGLVGGFQLCRRLVDQAVPPYDVPALFLLGWAAWRRRDSVLARAAAARALTVDPAYDAARLLLVALDHGVDPSTLPSVALPRRRRRRRR